MPVGAALDRGARDLAADGRSHGVHDCAHPLGGAYDYSFLGTDSCVDPSTNDSCADACGHYGTVACAFGC